MLRFVVHADGCWRPCGCLWYLCYFQKPMCKFMIHAATYWKCQGSFCCSGIYDCRLTVENERYGRLLQHLSPPLSPQRNSLDRKSLRRTLNLTFTETETGGYCGEYRKAFSTETFYSFINSTKGLHYAIVMMYRIYFDFP